MSLSAEKIELIDKWRINAALRSVNVFDNEEDDYAIFELVEQLTMLNDRRNDQERIMRLADEFVNLGLTDKDYRAFQEIVDARIEEKHRQRWHEDFLNNALVKRMHDQYNFKEVTGRGKNPKYFECNVNTDLHGLIKVKGRYVPAKHWYQSSNCIVDFKLPNKEKVRLEVNARIVDVDRRFPEAWWNDDVRTWSNKDARKTETFYSFGIHVIRKIEREYMTTTHRRKKKDVIGS
jgi:hypothetical protein